MIEPQLPVAIKHLGLRYGIGAALGAPARRGAEVVSIGRASAESQLRLPHTQGDEGEENARRDTLIGDRSWNQHNGLSNPEQKHKHH